MFVPDRILQQYLPWHSVFLGLTDRVQIDYQPDEDFDLLPLPSYLLHR